MVATGRRTFARSGFWTASFLLSVALLLGTACTADSESTPTSTATATSVRAAPTPTPAPAVQCTDEEASRRTRVSMVRIESGGLQGTGIVVGRNLVLTNAHVIDDRERIVVIDRGEASLGALYSLDRDADIALVNADTSELEAVSWADNTGLRAGQRLLSFGFALGLEGDPTIAPGIFSAVREEEGIPFVQTDADVRPGASGGPLTNSCGEVVGLNTLALDGLSFAIDGTYLQKRIALFLVAPAIDKDEPNITVTKAESTKGGCGPDVSITPTDAQIGRVYATGDTLSVTIDYPPNDCQIVSARFSGYFLAGAPWYEHWCAGDNQPFTCTDERLLATFYEHGNPQGYTVPDGGSVTLRASPGPFPPPNASTSPNLEGFHLCLIDVIFHDLAFGGQSVRFTISDTGRRC